MLMVIVICWFQLFWLDYWFIFQEGNPFCLYWSRPRGRHCQLYLKKIFLPKALFFLFIYRFRAISCFRNGHFWYSPPPEECYIIFPQHSTFDIFWYTAAYQSLDVVVAFVFFFSFCKAFYFQLVILPVMPFLPYSNHLLFCIYRMQYDKKKKTFDFTTPFIVIFCIHFNS